MKKPIGNMKNKKQYLAIIILRLMFVMIFVLNKRTLYISDDFLYRFEFRPGMASNVELEPVNGFLSLLRSQYYHYSLWNGRFVAHTIVQFFMQFDKWVFNVFNTIVYLVLVLLILKIGRYVANKNTILLCW